MPKKRKVKIYSYNGKKLLSLTEEQIQEIKVDEKYEKIHAVEFSKAKHRHEVKNYYSTVFWKDFMIIVLSAFITTIGIDYFISTTGSSGLFPGGFGAIARFFSILINSKFQIPASATYFIFYFLINAPLAIFGFFKIGGRFAISTVLFLLLSIVFDLIIQNLPYINPNELTMLIPIANLQKISSMGVMVLWLFIFAVFAGIINGFAYSLTYKANASTGGSDWITYYLSNRRNKSIGMLNVKINIVTLAIIITLNTIIMQPSDIESSFKMNQIYYQFKGDFNGLMNSDFWSTVNDIDSNSHILNSLPELSQENFEENWLKYCEVIASNSVFDSAYTDSMMAWIKFKFIFGPSLFASLILIIVQGITIDRCYPKNKIVNVMIYTAKIKEVQEYLSNVGYNNNVFVWQTKTSKKNTFSDKDQDLIMITISLVHWRKIQDHLMRLDDDIIVNTTITKAVKGKSVSYKLDNETRDKMLTEQILKNNKIMKKIENESIIKTYRKIHKAIKHKNNV